MLTSRELASILEHFSGSKIREWHADCEINQNQIQIPDEERMAESMVKKMKASVEPQSTASATEGWKIAAIRKSRMAE